MTEQDHSTREFRHVQTTPWRFQSSPYAPVTKEKGGSGKPRFAVEDSIYLSAVGMDIVDPMTRDNEYMVAFANYVAMKEMQGYEHTGLSSAELKAMHKKIWGENNEV